MKKLVLLVLFAGIGTSCMTMESKLYNKEANKQLLQAVENGNIENAQKALSNEAYVNTINCLVLTPLHIACKKGYVEIVQLLIKNKADVNAKTNSNNTPLHYACYKGHLDIVELLIANKANVNLKNLFAHTPLHIACMYGDLDIVELLTTNKAKVNTRAWPHDDPPLHIACKKGHIDIVKFLVRIGAYEKTTLELLKEKHPQKHTEFESWYEENKNDCGPGNREILILNYEYSEKSKEEKNFYNNLLNETKTKTKFSEIIIFTQN